MNDKKLLKLEKKIQVALELKKSINTLKSKLKNYKKDYRIISSAIAEDPSIELNKHWKRSLVFLDETIKNTRITIKDFKEKYKQL